MNDRMTAQQLKNSILQMAVQGKLVEQNPNDEPASVLLERIREEKEKLIKEGKIKRNKKESIIFKGSDNLHYEKIGNEVKCVEDEIPFDIPDSWEWARASSVGTMQRGSGIKRTEIKTSGKGCIRYGELYTTYDFSLDTPNSFITDDLFEKSKKIIRNDLVFTLTGENKKDIAKCAAYLGTECIAGGGDLAIWSNHLMNPLYISCYMASPIAIEYKQSLATGDIIIHISCDKVGSFLMPIPPRKEQDVIVEKYLSLTQLIQSYSSVEEKLYVLNSTYKEQLAKSILQYAIEGKLVEQDPNDEPVSVLLDRIKQEKNKLITEGKIKKDKNESYIFKRDNSYYENINGKVNCIDDEIPFEIHQSWQWIRLKNISTIQGGKRIPASRKLTTKNTGHIYIRVTDMQNGSIDQSDLHYIENDIFDCIKKYTISCNDLYITVAGTIGRIGVIPSNLDGANLTENANKIVFSNNLINKYWLYDTLNSPYIQNQINFYTTKVGQPKLAIKRIENILIALPPTDEQKRISREMKKIESILK